MSRVGVWSLGLRRHCWLPLLASSGRCPMHSKQLTTSESLGTSLRRRVAQWRRPEDGGYSRLGKDSLGLFQTHVTLELLTAVTPYSLTSVWPCSPTSMTLAMVHMGGMDGSALGDTRSSRPPLTASGLRLKLQWPAGTAATVSASFVTSRMARLSIASTTNLPDGGWPLQPAKANPVVQRISDISKASQASWHVDLEVASTTHQRLWLLRVDQAV